MIYLFKILKNIEIFLFYLVQNIPCSFVLDIITDNPVLNRANPRSRLIIDTSVYYT